MYPRVGIYINDPHDQSAKELECGTTMCRHFCQSRDDPRISQLGILRSLECGDTTKCPLLLPRNHPLIPLILIDAHKHVVTTQ